MHLIWLNLRSSPRRAAQDLMWLGLAALAVCVVGFALGIPQLVYRTMVGLGAGNGEVGFVLGVLAVALAIFGLRRWREVARTEASFRTLFENAPVGVFRSTRDGRLLLANTALAHLLGFDTPAQLVAAINGRTIQLYVNSECRAELVRLLEQDGIAENFENQVYRRDGSRIWLLCNVRAERDKDGKILFLEGNVQDITARKEMERAYQQLSLESLQSILIVQGRRPVFVNAQMSDAVGYTTSELMNLSDEQLFGLVHPEDRDHLAGRARDILDGKLVPLHYVFQFRRKDGQWRWAEAQINRIEFHGKPALMIAVVDITERKLAQDKMQENVQRAQFRQELGASLARGGNDLRTVLDNLTRVVVGDLGDICVVSLLSQDRSRLELGSFSSLHPEQFAELSQTLADARVPADHPLLHSVLTEGKPLSIAAVAPIVLEQYQVRDYVDYLRRYGIHSVLVVPLQHNGHILGLLGVARAGAERLYTIQDQLLLQEVADRAAQVITNALLVKQMETELRARTLAQENASAGVEQTPVSTATASSGAGDTTLAKPRVLLGRIDDGAPDGNTPGTGFAGAQEQVALAQALQDAAAFLNRANNVDLVWEGILDTVARIVPYDTATIFRRQGRQLHVVSGRGFEARGLGEWIGTITFPDDMPKYWALTLQAQAIVIPDTRASDLWFEIAETAWIRSHIAAPLRLGNETIGMLCLDSAVPDFYDAAHGARLMMFADLAAAALRHALLLRETEQRAEQLALLYDVGLTLNRVLDSRTQLDFLFKIARRALRADRVAFFVYDAQADVMQFDEGIGMPAELKELFRARGLSVNPPEGLVGQVAHRRVPLAVPDVSVSSHWVAVEDMVKSALAVPVEHENELRGVLLAASHQRNGFTAQDERMLILFANQVAAAIELTRLFQSQSGRQHELEILREASLAFAAAPDRDALTQLILEFALRLVTAHNAFLFFYQRDVLEFAGTLWSRTSPIEPENFAPRENGLTYTVARTGKQIVIDEVNTHPLFANWRWGGAIVGLPLKGGGQVRAVLNVAYEQPHRFTQEELRALELYAEQAAAALENARQSEETQRQLRDAQLLHRAGEALNRTQSVQAAFEQLAEFFMQAVGVEACCISTVDAAADQVHVIVDRDPDPATRLAPGTVGKLSAQPYLLELLNEQHTLIYHRDMPNLEPRMLASLKQYNWFSLLALPLFDGDRVMGVVELADQHTARVFSPESVRLAESLAHQAASALQNARLLEETRQRAEQLTLLNRLARQVGGSSTLDTMLESIENEIASIVPFDAFYIALYDSETELVDFRRVTDYGERKPPFQWRLGPSLTRQVITSGCAMRLADRKEYPSVDNPPQYYGDGSMLCAWLGVPIRFGDQVLGVISLQSKRRAAFSEADEQLLQTIADQVAGAIARVPHTGYKVP